MTEYWFQHGDLHITQYVLSNITERRLFPCFLFLFHHQQSQCHESAFEALITALVDSVASALHDTLTEEHNSSFGDLDLITWQLAGMMVNTSPKCFFYLKISSEEFSSLYGYVAAEKHSARRIKNDLTPGMWFVRKTSMSDSSVIQYNGIKLFNFNVSL